MSDLVFDYKMLSLIDLFYTSYALIKYRSIDYVSKIIYIAKIKFKYWSYNGCETILGLCSCMSTCKYMQRIDLPRHRK